MSKCKYCHGELDREGIYCSNCRKITNMWKMDWCKKQVSNGFCSNCNSKLDREGWFCSKCCENLKLKARVRNIERRLKGLCVQCGDTAEGGRSYCRRCLDMRMTRYYKKKSNGGVRNG